MESAAAWGPDAMTVMRPSTVWLRLAGSPVTKAMGTMASTLAHELNQPLSAIANYLKGSQRLLEESQDEATIR